MPARSFIATLALAAALAGCGGASGHAPENPRRSAACQPDHLDACELGIHRSLASGSVDRTLLDAYAAARASRDEKDPWVSLWRALAPRSTPGNLVVFLGKIGAIQGPEGAVVVRVTALPEPAGIASSELLMAMGGAGHIETIAEVHGSEVALLFPEDPLAPFIAGIPSVVRAGGALAHIEDDLAVAASLRRAFAAAANLEYVAAAKEAETLSALLAKGDATSEPARRARFALQLLGNAGLAVDPEPSETPLEAPAPLPDPDPKETPYGALLAVRLAPKDEASAWKLRREAILAAVPADRRAALDALFAPPSECHAAAVPPPMEGARDLIFAGKLASSVASADAPVFGGRDAKPAALGEWLARYEKLVAAVESTHTLWANAPSLLYERGELYGLRPVETNTYRHVTELGLAHLGALLEVERAFPGRFRVLSGLPLAYSPGVLGDAKLRDQVIALTQAGVQDRVVRAMSPEAVFEGVLAGASAALTYPPAVQSASLSALMNAFTAKLHGDLTRRSGWGVAGLEVVGVAARVATSQPTDAAFAAGQIVRALAEAPDLPASRLAGLARAGARYAALALDHKLNPRFADVARFPADRLAARDELGLAIAGLADPASVTEDPVPRNMLEDVTDLADGVLATLSVAFPEKPKPAAGTCPTKVEPATGAEARRALAKLGDVRQRILAYPRYREGRGTWVTRTKLLVTVLSDAMDVLALRDAANGRGGRPKESRKRSFTLSDEEAESNVKDALGSLGAGLAGSAATHGYLLARSFLRASATDVFLRESGGRIRSLMTALLLLVGDTTNQGTGGVALFRALSSARIDAPTAASDMTSLLLAYAKSFYDGHQQDPGDLMLLGSLGVGALVDEAPRPEAIDLAVKSGSRIEWALRFLAERDAGRRGIAPDSTKFAEGMRKALASRCAAGSVDAIADVTSAVRDFSTSRRSEARKTLDAVLARAEEAGLSIPRETFKYEEKTETRVMSLSLEMSYGGDLMTNANTLQIGLGVRSQGKPEGTLSTSFAPPASSSMAEDAARYYANVAALAAAYHFLEGDAARGAEAAGRVIATAVSGVRLGPRAAPSSVHLGLDVRPLAAIDAELAAEAGMPFLAGDLFTVARATLNDDTDDKAVSAILTPLPFGLASVKDKALDKAVERAGRSLRAIADPLPCTEAKIDLSSFDDGSCESYARAIGLRSADALKKLPHLRRGAETSTPQCASLRDVDDFLSPMDRGSYDPDAFLRAIRALKRDGRLYDAAVLMIRQRRETHCSPDIVTTARELGRSPSLGSQMKSDLLSVAVNCTVVGGASPALADDLLSLDRTTRELPDSSRNLHLMLFVADLALKNQAWTLLEPFPREPDFIGRWLSVNPSAATAALVVDHAASALNAQPIDLEKTAAAYALLCETYPPAERAEPCAKLKELRASNAAPDVARAQIAKGALQVIVTAAANPPRQP